MLAKLFTHELHLLAFPPQIREEKKIFESQDWRQRAANYVSERYLALTQNIGPEWKREAHAQSINAYLLSPEDTPLENIAMQVQGEAFRPFAQWVKRDLEAIPNTRKGFPLSEATQKFLTELTQRADDCCRGKIRYYDALYLAAGHEALCRSIELAKSGDELPTETSRIIRDYLYAPTSRLSRYPFRIRIPVVGKQPRIDLIQSDACGIDEVGHLEFGKTVHGDNRAFTESTFPQHDRYHATFKGSMEYCDLRLLPEADVVRLFLLETKLATKRYHNFERAIPKNSQDDEQGWIYSFFEVTHENDRTMGKGLDRYRLFATHSDPEFRAFLRRGYNTFKTSDDPTARAKQIRLLEKALFGW